MMTENYLLKDNNGVKRTETMPNNEAATGTTG
jgi:hypothetical protein